MPALHLTIIFHNEPTIMPQQSMSRRQREEALRSVSLLTVPYLGIVENVFQFARDIVASACDREHGQLTYTPKVVTGLATLQSAVQDLSRAYIAHTNTVIGKSPGSSLELLNLAGPLGGENAIFGGNRAATPAAPQTIEAGESKKRKRAPHDKNAPKRPVTPYFLYMKTARAEIAKEMTPGHSAKEVADEGTKRWLTMPAKEKKVPPSLCESASWRSSLMLIVNQGME